MNLIADYNPSTSLRHPLRKRRVKIYADLAGDRKKQRIKSHCDNNVKSLENGIMGTYIAAFGGYNFGKLFTVATKKRQSRIAWEEMAKFVRIDPELGEFFKVKDYKSLIECSETFCTIEALSKEAGLDDGFRSIYSSIDEIHQHKDNKIYKALYNGTRSLPETLQSMITTRGDRLNSFCKEMDDYAISILNGTATAEDFFIDIYCPDPGDDLWDEESWKKANPFTFAPGNEELLEILRADAQTARDMGGSDLRDFLTKSLNIWVENTDDNFIDTEKWKECGSDESLADHAGERCWVGLDLSSGGDLTTLALEFEKGKKIHVYSHSFMPRGRLEEHIETDLAPYDLWEQMELITVTGGSSDFKNDYKFIIQHLAELKDEYRLTFDGIAIDPHNADGVLADLESFGCPVVVITQSARNLNDATQDVQLLVKSGDVSYNRNNELLTWSMNNAKIVRNSFAEIKVDKRPGQYHKRIDPVDAWIDAHAGRLTTRTKETVDIDDELEKYLKAMGWKT